ncbi:PRTase-like protein [Jaminaea rosea]|uniref:PRTase-like protein n=1 Tax=Jaminaea rosea TaxID=1569628 RepID=A0A316USW0_9BASI|nr:PRTase-like protein [Jaminaea rosea]PWN27878.1 PRTase-like protein [Jaminaea rosea]
MASSSSAAASQQQHETVPDDHYRVTYEEIHEQISRSARLMRDQFRPDVLVPIMGGGMIPARVLRTFLKVPSEVDSSKKRNIPIQAIGLALYEEVAGTSAESMGREVIRTQWLDEGTFKRSHHAKQPSPSGAGAAGGLLGKNILIVDEVDDTRTTLQYAYQELLADVQKGLAALDPAQRAALPPTRFAIFVVHNKHREGGKKGVLPLMAGQGEGWKLEDQKVGQDGVGEGVWYYSADETGDCWVDYPWETEDILEHNRLATLAKKLGVNTGRPPVKET